MRAGAQPARRPEAQLAAMGIVLPASPPAPIGAFCNVRAAAGLLFVSGQGPIIQAGAASVGTVGVDVSLEKACADARLVALNILAAVRAHCGTLDEIAGVVKLTGLVNAASNFADHPAVIDAASALMAEIFGPSGVHARTSYGVSSLPNGITVEIDAIFELHANGKR